MISVSKRYLVRDVNHMRKYESTKNDTKRQNSGHGNIIPATDCKALSYRVFQLPKDLIAIKL